MLFSMSTSLPQEHAQSSCKICIAYQSLGLEMFAYQVTHNILRSIHRIIKIITICVIFAMTFGGNFSTNFE